jgi:hypothetical protein
MLSSISAPTVLQKGVVTLPKVLSSMDINLLSGEKILLCRVKNLILSQNPTDIFKGNLGQIFVPGQLNRPLLLDRFSSRLIIVNTENGAAVGTIWGFWRCHDNDLLGILLNESFSTKALRGTEKIEFQYEITNYTQNLAAYNDEKPM